MRARLGLLALPVLLLALPATAVGRPEVGTAPSGPAPGAIRFGQGAAIPLRGSSPSWFTPQLEQRVLAAAGAPVAAPQDAPLPTEIGIRPGAWMIAPHGCTMSFIFAKSGALAIGTAGHCTDKIGQQVTLLTLAPGGANPVLVNVGSVIARANGGVGNDFALVSIRSELRSWVSPTMGLVAGPCGAFTGSGVQTVAHVGHGLAIGTGGTPRIGVATTWRADAYGWDGAGIFGDSGSPVRVTDLKAAGNLTHLVVDTRWLPSFIVGTRISKILKIAKGWSLRSSPLCL